jgi:hypothetical protein
MTHARLFSAFVFMTLASLPASAQPGKYCLRGFNHGYPGDCSYNSYAECKATASGMVEECVVNPMYSHARDRNVSAPRQPR